MVEGAERRRHLRIGGIEAQLDPQGARDVRHDLIERCDIGFIEVGGVLAAAHRQKAVEIVAPVRDHSQGPVPAHRPDIVVEQIAAQQLGRRNH